MSDHFNLRHLLPALGTHVDPCHLHVINGLHTWKWYKWLMYVLWSLLFHHFALLKHFEDMIFEVTKKPQDPESLKFSGSTVYWLNWYQCYMYTNCYVLTYPTSVGASSSSFVGIGKWWIANDRCIALCISSTVQFVSLTCNHQFWVYHP